MHVEYFVCSEINCNSAALPVGVHSSCAQCAQPNEQFQTTVLTEDAPESSPFGCGIMSSGWYRGRR